LIKWDKEGHCILITSVIQQKEITIINLYAPNVSATSFIKHTLKDLKAHTDSNTVVVGDFNTRPLPIGSSCKQKIKKQILEPNDSINQMDLTEVYWILHPTTTQYTFFSVAHGTFTKIEYILRYKEASANIRK
jgi:exonuclease III